MSPTQNEVFVCRGHSPRWSSDGTELFYVRQNRLVSVGIKAGFIEAPVRERIGKSRELFDASTVGVQLGLWSYEVAPDGKRFLGSRMFDQAMVPR